MRRKSEAPRVQLVPPGGLIVVLALGMGLGVSAARAADEQGAEGPAIDGRQLFAGTCGFCHQAGGRKAGRGPRLAGNKRSDEYRFNRIAKGKPGRMPAYGNSFTEKQIWDIVAYIRSLNAE